MVCNGNPVPGGALNGEPRIKLAKAAEFIERRYGDKRPSASTFHRWAHRGIAGVRLEIECIGRSTYTSVAAIERFIEAVSIARTRIPVVEIKIEPTAVSVTKAAKSSAAAELQRRVFRSKRTKSTTAKGGAK